MRRMIIVAVGTLLLGACAGSPNATDSFSNRSRVAEKTQLIRTTHKSLRTASCKSVDEAMAYSYLLHRTLTDKSVVKSRDDKIQGAALIYKGYYGDFLKEHGRRCKGTPLRTRAVQKMYPDILREAQRQRQERASSQLGR